MFKKVLMFLFLCKICDGVEFRDLRYFGERVRNMSLEMFYFTQLENEGDLVMAPFSLWYLISLVAFKSSSDTWRQLHSIIGISKRNGQYFNSIFKFTTDVMTDVSKFPGVSFKNVQIVFCDANLELTQSFQRSVIDSGMSLKMLDFEDGVSAAEEANHYYQNLSNNTFSPELLIFDSTTFNESSMILSGIVEFEGNWSLPFKKSDTILKNGTDIYIMQQKANIQQVNIDILGASVLELNYGKSEDFNMVVLTPHEGVSIKDVLINFDKISFTDLLSKLHSEPLKEVDVKLPKFSVISTISLNDPLTSMEARDIFLPSRADFSGITEEEMYISSIEHRALITVTETGTRATAFTPANSSKDRRTTITDSVSPFLFLIVYRPSYNILFCGKYGA
ncbi:serpin I2-like [Danaus plexippus]|uniref:serpin I2-like n=1 Tax=Danaus plexippus TaxID=13037 RepID=UPI002AB1811D|nr:serpin I2-like [Danaus plexippus]